MTKFLLILLIICNANMNILAQDQIAQNILEKLNETTQSYKNIKIEFELIYENKSQNITDLKKGNLFLENDKFYLTMNNQTIINNGETQWIYLSDINELQIITPDPESNIISPNKIFNVYKEEYKYTYIGDYVKNGERFHTINLFPRESQEFMKIKMTINDQKNQLKEMIIFDKNGGTYKYVIKLFQPNTTSKEFIFNISDFPDIEVIDLR